MRASLTPNPTNRNQPAVSATFRRSRNYETYLRVIFRTARYVCTCAVVCVHVFVITCVVCVLCGVHVHLN